MSPDKTPDQNLNHRVRLEKIARTLHETRMKFCYLPGYDHKQPWPEKMPPDFGYVPQPWVDIAWEQAKAVLKMEKLS